MNIQPLQESPGVTATSSAAAFSKGRASPVKSESSEAPYPHGLQLKKILVPIDFSKVSRKALDYAIPLARQFGARITLLHVVEPLPYPSDMAYFPTGEIFPLKAMKNDLETMAVGEIDPEILDHTQVEVGAPYEVIVNAAREERSDLIVLTTHGYTGLKHVFMGSTAERVVRHAPCPVFVVRRREHDIG